MSRTILVFALAACNGDTDTEPTGDTGDTVDTVDTMDTMPQTYDPTWAGVELFFADHCDRCHPSVQYIDLHTAIPYDIQTAYGEFVVPGDPDASALWQVLSAPNALQFPMPYDTGLLPAATVDHVRQWIADGALIP